MKYILSTFVLLITIISLQGQSEDGIMIISRNYENQVVLRWAPTSTYVWVKGIRKGYTVEKYDEQNKTWTVLGDTIKVWSQDQLIPYLQKDEGDQGLLLQVECVQGDWEDFQSDMTNMRDALYKSTLLNNRYVMSLFAADISRLGSVVGGLRFETTDLSVGDKVRVRVENYVSNVSEIENVYRPVRPYIESIDAAEGLLTLEWDKEYHDSHFNSYYLERSQDGKSWKKLNDIPYVNPETDITKANLFHVYSDHVEKDKLYYYRIQGIDPFANISQYSNVVSGVASGETPPPIPTIDQLKVADSNDEITIEWSIPSAENLSGFIITRASNVKGPYAVISDELIAPRNRMYMDKEPIKGKYNFYKVICFDSEGRYSSSMPMVKTLVDNEPPAVPTEFTYDIDSSGIIEISWPWGKERDLLGYEIYTCSKKDGIYQNESDRPLRITKYVDTTTLNTLDKAKYFKIRAADYSYNFSEYSEPIEIKIPDTIPPLAPVMKSVEIQKEDVSLVWYNVTNRDIAKYTLLYRKEGQQQWVELGHTDVSKSSFTYPIDKLDQGSTYNFILQAEDDSGNTSRAKSYQEIEIPRKEKKYSAKELAFRVDKKSNVAELTWSIPKDFNGRVILYKSIGNQSDFKILKTHDYSILSYSDRNIESKKQYYYCIGLENSLGKQVALSEITKL